MLGHIFSFIMSLLPHFAYNWKLIVMIMSIYNIDKTDTFFECTLANLTMTETDRRLQS